MDEEKANFNDFSSPMIFDLGTGLLYANKRFYFGMSAMHIMPKRAVYYESPYQVLLPNYYLSAGYKFDINEKLSFLTSGLMKHISLQRTIVDATFHIKYNDFLWAGASLRTNFTYSAQFGMRVSDLFLLTRQSVKIGYAFDWSPRFSNFSNELFLILDLNMYASPKKIRNGKSYISPVLF